MLEYFLISYLCLILFFMLMSAWNSMGYRDVLPEPFIDRNHPFVSVIIPARNEVNNIKSCIDSLVSQDYPDYEIIVVDGGSTDGTCCLLDEYAEKYENFKWIPEKPLPKDWVGKSYACWLGVDESNGDWLFFIDADTVHHKQMINSVVLEIQNYNLDFFSLMTGQKLGSFWENVILPDVFLWFGTKFPIRKVNSQRSKIARATGQFIAIRKDVYGATKGHEAIKSKVVEDFAFSHLVKQSGYRIKISGGRKIVTTRMYRDFQQILEGFSKNIYFAAGENLRSTLYAVFYILVTQVLPFAVPFVMFFTDEISSRIIILACLPALIVLFARMQLNFLLKLSHFYLWSIPLGGIFTIYLQLNSAHMYLSGKGMLWKGRIYGAK